MIDWFDDLKLGMRFVTPERRITREDIVRFAREFDPQPFHTDEAAAARKSRTAAGAPCESRSLWCPSRRRTNFFGAVISA